MRLIRHLDAFLPDHRSDRIALAVLTATLSAILGLVTWVAPQPTAVLASAAVRPMSLNEVVIEGDASEVYRPTEEDVLWTARAIYSETKQPHEQELVAWVVRNRLETGYRNRSSYQDVVLDPLQFSAFNPGSPVRSFYMSLDPGDTSRGWKTAIGIARRVVYAHPNARPFDHTVRHFYSEQSMVGRREPVWAKGKDPVELPHVQEERFRFFADVN